MRTPHAEDPDDAFHSGSIGSERQVGTGQGARWRRSGRAAGRG
ncbi:MAG: hypothetical protein ABIO59_01020 [Luteimonas sp.]